MWLSPKNLFLLILGPTSPVDFFSYAAPVSDLPLSPPHNSIHNAFDANNLRYDDRLYHARINHQQADGTLLLDYWLPGDQIVHNVVALGDAVAGGAEGSVHPARLYEPGETQDVAMKISEGMHEAQIAGLLMSLELPHAIQVVRKMIFDWKGKKTSGKQQADGSYEQIQSYVAFEIMKEDMLKVVQRSENFGPDEVKKFLCHIAETLKTMHLKGYIHRDVKLENVMRRYEKSSRQWVYKLIDFSFVRLVDVFQVNPYLDTGTKGYMAPGMCFLLSSSPHRPLVNP